MKRKKILFVIAAALLAGYSQAADIIDQNFDSFAPGVYSNLGVYAASTFGARMGSAVTVVSVTTDGLLANGADQALQIGGKGTPAWSITYGPAATGATQGVFRIDFAATTAAAINLGGAAATTAQIQLLLASDNRIGHRLIVGGVTNWYYFDQTWTKNAEQTLEVTYNATTKLFTGKINGTSLTMGVTNTFGFTRSNLASIGDVTMFYSTAGTTFWVDNLKLEMIPESSSPMWLFPLCVGFFQVRFAR